jgi:hypothetical protein
MVNMEQDNFIPSQNATIAEQKASIIFMAFLLIVSAVTASIVGFRVKQADLDRKAQELETYTRLGGSFERANTLGFSLYQEGAPTQRNTFALAYEVNWRARTHGLYRVLETTPAPIMEETIKSLFAINATEAAHSTADAWRAFQRPMPGTEDGSRRKNVNPEAARYARQYDRYLARDTEVKLFTYLRDQRDKIAPTNAGQ